MQKPKKKIKSSLLNVISHSHVKTTLQSNFLLLLILFCIVLLVPCKRLKDMIIILLRYDRTGFNLSFEINHDFESKSFSVKKHFIISAFHLYIHLYLFCMYFLTFCHKWNIFFSNFTNNCCLIAYNNCYLIIFLRQWSLISGIDVLSHQQQSGIV